MKQNPSPSALFVLAAVLGCASAAAPSASASTPAAPARAAGVTYTIEQAERGAARYDEICLECHTKVEFTERPFLFAWEGSSVGQLYAYITENMPEDGPGSLAEGDYLAVMAYILRMNGYPDGDQELAADIEAMRAVPFEAKEGAGN